ncbi:hypothetical protein XMM379_000186 [Aliiroseovarius sp. xm-m-379]|uniref:DMP19 family protein n=1 Tax=unclassified Aliiroseovarius TaxID=2623558 RepID=UPI001569B480|nr:MULTISPECIES: DUF4375 domain-containing protein [unclassified Aliiroseovarius]NRP14031.1 hypothetical protein [Aliiroseovarius sp. xm-d-517]NRP23515.1 hypothetical protein [Aliiroseovarius sp. xm-m-379]NRP29239.1 hypothetical protein [Aliiroseovarius sp. xm-m-314]NRP32314.1 hypothetical protein [Aliiroseovarius sp. xm-a-104]NRP40847.1 hypothetical protein [Aliiroseovarius sp. xm-m-339-2]
MFRYFSKFFHRRHDIFVPASVVAQDAKDYALVGSVVSWVNAARNRGAYTADEIAKEAPQVYNADYYYSQVCNGGHSQFRHNSKMDPMTLAHAQNGLKSAGLTELAECLAALVKAPEMEKSALDALDARFFAAHANYHSMINAWLLPRVRVVPDAVYTAKLEQFLKPDSVRSQRVRDREALRLQALIENTQLAGFAHAILSMTGQQLIGVRPGHFASILGLQTVIWGIAVRTEQGKEAILNGMEVANRLLVAPEIKNRSIETEEQLIALIKSGYGLSKETKETIEESCRQAHNERLGVIAALLLERVPDFSPQEVTALHLLLDNVSSNNGHNIVVHNRGDRGHFVILIDRSQARILNVTEQSIVVRMSNRGLKKALRQFDARTGAR